MKLQFALISAAAMLGPLAHVGAVTGGGGGEQASGEFWRGTVQAKTCKICLYLANRIYDEKRRWPKDTGNHTMRLLEYCANGRPKKGHPMLAFFGGIPSAQTHAEVGTYCTKVARTGLQETAIRTFKKSAAVVSSKETVGMSLCSDGKGKGFWGPGAGYCDQDYTKADGSGKMAQGAGRSKQGVKPEKIETKKKKKKKKKKKSNGKKEKKFGGEESVYDMRKRMGK